MIDFDLQSILYSVITYQLYHIEYHTGRYGIYEKPYPGVVVGFRNATFTNPRGEVFLFRVYVDGLYIGKTVSISVVGYVNASISGPILPSQPGELLTYRPVGKSVSTYFNGSFDRVNWFILGLSSLMTESCMFSVSSTRDIDSPQPILFDRVLLNQCSMYQVSTGHFVAPKAGIYYLHINVGCMVHDQLTVHMVTQDQTLGSVQGKFVLGPYLSVRVYHMGAWCITQLSEGEHVWLQLTKGKLRNTPGFDITKFQGFLYEPKHGPKIAWSVFLSKDYTGPHRRSDEPIKPVAPDVVLLNEGGVYDPVTHFFTIKTSGNYLLRETGGITVRKMTHQWDGKDINPNTQDLMAGDQLYIVDQTLFGDPQLPTGFMGLLLYEI